MKFVLVGDCHFGIKKFNKSFLKSQLEYLKEVVNFASENKFEIFQLGDLFDNRITADIEFLSQIVEFFKFVESKKVKFHTLLGNHDIYYRQKLDVNLSSIIAKIYPKTLIVYEKPKIIEFNSKKILIHPWITANDTFASDLYAKADAVFGHFEINGFEMVKGHIAQNSNFNQNDFAKPIFTGHFHNQSHRNFIHYIGTPYQLTWNDFNESKGVYILDENLEYTFLENTQSKRFIQIHYNSNNDNQIKTLGLIKDFETNLQNLSKFLENLRYNIIKVIIHSGDSSYEDLLFMLREANIDFEVVNKYKIDEIELNDTKISTTKEIIMNFLSENHIHYVDEISQMIGELDEN